MQVDYPSGYGFEVKDYPLPYKSEDQLNQECAKNAMTLINSLYVPVVPYIVPYSAAAPMLSMAISWSYPWPVY